MEEEYDIHTEFLCAVSYLYYLEYDGYKPLDEDCCIIIKIADRTKALIYNYELKEKYKIACNEIETELNKVQSYKTANKLQKHYYRNRKEYYKIPKIELYDDKILNIKEIKDIEIIINIYDKGQEIKWKMEIEEQRKEKRIKKLNNKEV